jgi:MFS family permease
MSPGEPPRDVASAQVDPLDSLDDSKISRFRIKIMFVSGMGFFTDADDLIMSEYAGKNTGGRMAGAVFANQAAGLIVGPLIPSIFLASGLSDNSPGWCWAR